MAHPLEGLGKKIPQAGPGRTCFKAALDVPFSKAGPRGEVGEVHTFAHPFGHPYLFPRQALHGPRQHLLRQPRLHGKQQAQHLVGRGGVSGVDAWKETHAGFLSRYCESPASARTVVNARTCEEVRLAADAVAMTVVVLIGLVGRSSPQ